MSEFVASYRVQLSRSFSFENCNTIVPLLKCIGVSHIYLSPFFEAEEHCDNFYLVCDPKSVSFALGGEEGLRKLSKSISIIADIVPHHMSTKSEYFNDPSKRRKWFVLFKEGYRTFDGFSNYAALNMSDNEVFFEYHKTLIRLVDENIIQGLRIDHFDGLYDGANYLKKIRDQGLCVPIWLESVIPVVSTLPQEAVGTVGYEFLSVSQGLLLYSSNQKSYFEQLKDNANALIQSFFRDIAQECFHLDVKNLALLEKTSEKLIYDYLATKNNAELQSADCKVRFRQLLLGIRSRSERRARCRMAGSPDMEYGCIGSFEPISADEFHRLMMIQQQTRPLTMNSRETHDTFWSADSRARLCALEYRKKDWLDRVVLWKAAYFDSYSDQLADVVFRTIYSSWPVTASRLLSHFFVVFRDAAEFTNWNEPCTAWEESIVENLVMILEDKTFCEIMDEWVAEMASISEWFSLSQLILQLNVPGIPDIFWGTELQRFSLSDPDQRREFSWDERQKSFERVISGKGTTEDARMSLIVESLRLRKKYPDYCECYSPVISACDILSFKRGEHVLIEIPLHPDKKLETQKPFYKRLIDTNMCVGLYERETL